jgi:hypothetical protein
LPTGRRGVYFEETGIPERSANTRLAAATAGAVLPIFSEIDRRVPFSPASEPL